FRHLFAIKPPNGFGHSIPKFPASHGHAISVGCCSISGRTYLPRAWTTARDSRFFRAKNEISRNHSNLWSKVAASSTYRAFGTTNAKARSGSDLGAGYDACGDDKVGPV